MPYLIATLFGEHSAAAVFGVDTVKAKAYRQVDVTSISQLQKSPNLFAPFTFATLPDKQAMFIWPYDYFALSIQGTFLVNRFCLADLYEAPFVPQTDICLPGEPTDYYIVKEGGADSIATEDEI